MTGTTSLVMAAARSRAVESPSGTIITTAAPPSIVASSTPGVAGAQNVLAITTGGQISCNGTTIGGSGVVELYYIGHTAFQFNGTSWWGPITASSTGGAVASPIPTITGITLTNNGFTGGAASGTTVGTISVQTSGNGGAFTGTLSLTGTDAAKFKLSGTTLQTNGVDAAGTYAINIVATQASMVGSPFSQAATITGSAAATTITGITLSGATFTGGAASGTIVGTIAVQTSGTAFSGALSLSGTDAAKFQISGTTLQTSGVDAAGTYAINIVATQAGMTGSPFTQAESITGSAASGGAESANGASIFVAGSSINASPTPGSAGSGNLIAFTTGGGITVNGTAVGAATTAIALFYGTNHSCYWLNHTNVWTGPVTASSLGATVTAPPGVGGQFPPSQAILAGFFTKNATGSDDFTSTTVAPAGTFTGFKWFLASGATSAVWSINAGATASGNFASPNGGVMTLTGFSGNGGDAPVIQSVPLGHLLPNNAFNHGYFELYGAFPALATNTGNGWTGFWSWAYSDVSTGNGGSTIVEVDFMEYYSNDGVNPGKGGATWHTWSRAGGGFAQLGTASIGLVGSSTHTSGGVMDSAYHTWGFLWTGSGGVGAISVYLDNVKFGGPVATGLTANGAQIFLEDAGQQRVIALSAGQVPWTIDWFNVWQ
jgi:fibronectin-binding autotransporter adhesin